MAEINDTSNLFSTGGGYGGRVPTGAGATRKESSSHSDLSWWRRGFNSWRKSQDLMLCRSSRGRFNFCDTTIGGDYAINTQYQYTRFADIKARTDVAVGCGRGRFYGEQIADNAHDIHLRFGVQMFSNPWIFFMSWFDYPSHRMATTGRMPSILFTLGKLIGYGISWVMPQIIAMNYLGRILAAMTHSRFAYVKPAMPVYWQICNNLVNSIASNMGVMMPVSDAMLESKIEYVSGKTGNVAEEQLNAANNYIDAIIERMPGIYRKTWANGVVIDMAKVATRAQKLANRFNDAVSKAKETKLGENANNYDWWLGNGAKWFAKVVAQAFDWDPVGPGIDTKNSHGSTQEYLYAYGQTAVGNPNSPNNGNSMQLQNKELQQAQIRRAATEPEESAGSYFGGDSEDNNGWWKALYAAIRNGAEWITFRVDATGTASESFSNSTSESDIASAFNNFAKQKQKMNFNLSGGAIMTEIGQKVLTGMMELLQGTLDSIGLSGLGGLLTGSMIEVPKTWSDSSVSLPKISYSIKLRTPYGHPLAILQDLMMPLCCLIAGCAPLAHGQNAYGGPLYCECYDRGRTQIKMGLMGSLSISRGTANVPWTRFGQPLGIDCSFDIIDCETIMALPVTTTTGISDIPGDFIGGKIVTKLFQGSDTPLDDYLMVLASVGLTDQIYTMNRFQNRIRKLLGDYTTMFSADRWIGTLMNSTPLMVLQYIGPHTGATARGY